MSGTDQTPLEDFPVALSFVESRTDQHMQTISGTWTEILPHLLVPEGARKDGAGIIGAIPKREVMDEEFFSPRRSSSVAEISMLILDVEDHDYGADDISVAELIRDQIFAFVGTPCALAIYTTWSHGLPEKWQPGHPRLRVVIPLASPIPASEYPAIFSAVATAIPGTDPATKDLARIQYTRRETAPGAQVEGWAWHTGLDFPPLAPALIPVASSPNTEEVDAHDTDPLETARALVEQAAQALPEASSPIEVAFAPELTTALATLTDAGEVLPVERFYALCKGISGVSVTTLRSAVKKATPIADNRSEDGSSRREEFSGSLGIEALKGALSHINLPSSGGYDLWRDIGMALADYAREGHISRKDAAKLFIEWSKGQPGYQGAEDCVSTFKSFQGKGITIGTLVHHAREGGWKAPLGSAVATGHPGDHLLVGDEAEVAKILFSALREEVRPEVRGTLENGRQDEITVSEIPTLAYSQGAVWKWDRSAKLWQEQHQHLTKAELTQKWSGAPVLTQSGSRPLKISSSFASGVHSLLSSVVRTEAEIPGDSWMRPDQLVGAVAVEGGVLGLHENGQVALLQDHPAWLQRSRVAAAWEPRSCEGASHWQGFLDAVFGTDDEGMARQQAVQEYVGAVVFGMAHSLQKILLLRGEGLNGKGTLMRAVSSLIPDHARVAVTPQQMKDTSREGMHLLLTARLNLVGDVDKGDLVETGLLKRVTGEDEVSFGVKYEPEPRRGTVRCGHIWSVNKYPAVRDQSAGFWRRWHIVRFDRSFAGKEDPHLEASLERDLGVLLAWAVEGAQRLIRQGMRLTTPRCHTEELAQWKTATDSVRAWVQEARDEKKRERISAAHVLYKSWCEQAGLKPLAKKNFSDRMRTLADEGQVPRTRPGNAVHYGVGMVLDVEDEPETSMLTLLAN